MGLKKGQTNNSKGRPKGKPNKSTDELRSLLQLFIENNIDDLQQTFEKLEPKDKLNFIDRLLKHTLPAPVSELERLTDEQLDLIITKLREYDKQKKKN